MNEDRHRELLRKFDTEGHLKPDEWEEFRGYERLMRAAEFAARGFQPDGKTPLVEESDEPMHTSKHAVGQEMDMPPVVVLPKLSLIQRVVGWLLRWIMNAAPPDLATDLVAKAWDKASPAAREEITGILARQAVIERMEKSVIPQVFKVHEERADYMVEDLKSALEGTRMFMKPAIVNRFQGMEAGIKVLAARFDEEQRQLGRPSFEEIVDAVQDVGPKLLADKPQMKLVGRLENDDEGQPS